MTKKSKITAQHIQDWLTFFSKYMHLFTPEQEKAMTVSMISGKPVPKNFKPKKSDSLTLKQARKHISETIHRYLVASKMKPSEFAKAMGRSRPYVSLIANGKRSPNVVDLQKAMNILRIPAKEIFTVLAK